MKKLIGGYDTKVSSYRIYDFEGSLVYANGLEASAEIMETLAIYMTTPWEKVRKYKFFKSKNGETYCECVMECESFEAFMCGYGSSEQEAFEDCLERMDDLISIYVGKY